VGQVKCTGSVIGMQKKQKDHAAQEVCVVFLDKLAFFVGDEKLLHKRFT